MVVTVIDWALLRFFVLKKERRVSGSQIGELYANLGNDGKIFQSKQEVKYLVHVLKVITR